MASNNMERRQHWVATDRFLDLHRSPAHLRDRGDAGVRIAGHSVIIFETQPDWVDPTKAMQTPVVKTTYIRRRNRRRVFWMKGDLRWHGYEPALEVGSLRAFLDLVHTNENCCFGVEPDMPNAIAGRNQVRIHPGGCQLLN